MGFSENKTLWIIRGLPGSGKSTLAVAMMGILPDCVHYEADMFHMVGGEYKWKPENVPKSHNWCQRKVGDALLRGHKNIIVSNTSLNRNEYEIYLTMANIKGYSIKMICCKGDFGSIHNVPDNVLEKMARRFRWDEEYQEDIVYDAESFCKSLRGPSEPL